MSLDLPLVWAGLIAIAVLAYVVLDGFDLGIGLLFPFARTAHDRDVMMNSVAPVWDGNETWLVLGGGGLFAAFPLAYSILMPALYLPVGLMLTGLILRGVAFEFRFRGQRRGRPFWTFMFAAGSYMATFAQGLVLGGFIQGVRVEGERFAGGPFDWLTPYTLLVACGLVAGYGLLGAAWLVAKTENELQGDACTWAKGLSGAAAFFLAAVSAYTLVQHPRVAERWGWEGFQLTDPGQFVSLLAIPALGAFGLFVVQLAVRKGWRSGPFLGAVLVFLSGYLGLAIGFFPYVVPYAVDFRAAAAPQNSLELMFWGAAVILPLILIYTAYVYWVFRGKVAAEGYHG